ncbi:hypothetical protein T484DRAFT_1892900 [Baffinella frigidus]|nr:hypothetical protein T484DRAFT_1892900 [Cryptophyta sp. CCMP2293]
MPWRECIFTDTGVVFPPSWDLHSEKGRVISASMGPVEVADDASLAAMLPHGPSDRIATQDIFARRDDAPWSPAASPKCPSDLIATQGLLSRLTSAPESPAVPSLPRTDERAALPAVTSPSVALRTDKQQDSSGLEPRRQSTCFKAVTRVRHSRSTEKWLADLNSELGEYRGALWWEAWS